MLHRLLALLPESHGYVPYLVLGADTYLGQNVGMITRVDPVVSLYRSTEHVPYPVSASTAPYTLDTTW